MTSPAPLEKIEREGSRNLRAAVGWGDAGLIRKARAALVHAQWRQQIVSQVIAIGPLRDLFDHRGEREVVRVGVAEAQAGRESG